VPATVPPASLAGHGAARLPSVEIDSFNIELKDDEGYLGDRASKGSFRISSQMIGLPDQPHLSNALLKEAAASRGVTA
jgi:hypothetical protein